MRAITLEVTRAFSPNGDGVKDRAVVRYTLPRASEDVTLTISYRRAIRTVRVVHLGAQERGENVWVWDGRRGNGEVAREAAYTVEVTAQYPRRPITATDRVVVDTEFSADLHVERYGAPRSEPNKVYPRSTEVVDALPITARTESRLKRARLVIRDSAGRLVARRDIKAGRQFGDGWVREMAWTARRNGKPLPVGRYRATVVGVDQAGNSGRSQDVRIFVSADRLIWREEIRNLTPSQTNNGCSYFTGNDGTCALDYYCGEVVSSEVFAGGLSHRSAPCPPESGGAASEWSKAVSWHLAEVPTAVRGVERARVGFAGSPTYPGETDPGTLSIGETSTASSIGAQSPWIEDPPLGDGGFGDLHSGEDPTTIPPSVFWQFSTAGDDAFDVSTFTLDLRYLVVQ